MEAWFLSADTSRLGRLRSYSESPQASCDCFPAVTCTGFLTPVSGHNIRESSSWASAGIVPLCAMGHRHCTQHKALVKCLWAAWRELGTQVMEQMVLSWGRSWLVASWG